MRLRQELRGERDPHAVRVEAVNLDAASCRLHPPACLLPRHMEDRTACNTVLRQRNEDLGLRRHPALLLALAMHQQERAIWIHVLAPDGNNLGNPQSTAEADDKQ